jgi:hypothetical protein
MGTQLRYYFYADEFGKHVAHYLRNHHPHFEADATKGKTLVSGYAKCFSARKRCKRKDKMQRLLYKVKTKTRWLFQASG